MRQLYYNNKKIVDQLIIFILMVAAAYLFFKYVFSLIAPFAVAMVLSVIITKPVDFISGKSHIPRSLAAVFSMIIILLSLGIVVNLFFVLLIRQFVSFAADFPVMFDSAVNTLNNLQYSFSAISHLFPVEIEQHFTNGVINAIPAVISAGAKIVRDSSVYIVKLLPKTVLFIIITIIATFFMTKDYHIIKAFLKRQAPKNASRVYSLLKGDMFHALWGYVRAQLMLMSMTAAICVLGLTVMGYSYSFLIGVIIAALDALPVLGAGFVLWPWALYCAVTGRYSFALCLFILYAVVLIARQIAEPKVLGSQIGVYPLITLMSIYIGVMSIGAAGIFIGPVFVITVKSLQKGGFLPGFK